MAEVERLRVEIEKSEESVLAEVRGAKNDREFAFGRYLRFRLENLSAPMA
jgi:hypothetical protein